MLYQITGPYTTGSNKLADAPGIKRGGSDLEILKTCFRDNSC